MNTIDQKIARKTSTQYWGFRELSIEEAECVSGGGVEECMSDGDGLEECIPRITIQGPLPGGIEIAFAPTSYLPTGMTVVGGTSTGGGQTLPPMTAAQKEDFCTRLANEAVAEINRAKKDGRITFFALPLVPTDAQIYAAARQLCMNTK